MSNETEVPVRAPRATRLQIVLAVLAVAATIAVGAFVWIDTAKGDAPTPAATDSAPALTSGPRATRAPTIAPTPTPTEVAPSPTAGDGEEEPLQDLSAPKSLAANIVTQYLTWDDAETPDARAARLAPFFAPGSPFLTGRPNSANPKYADDATARVTTKISGQVYSSPVSVTDAVANFKVVAQYESIQIADGYRYTFKGAATYEVTVPLNPSPESKVINFEDPRFMF